MITTIINGVLIEAETLQAAHFTEVKVVRKPYVPMKKVKKKK